MFSVSYLPENHEAVAQALKDKKLKEAWDNIKKPKEVEKDEALEQPLRKQNKSTLILYLTVSMDVDNKNALKWVKKYEDPSQAVDWIEPFMNADGYNYGNIKVKMHWADEEDLIFTFEKAFELSGTYTHKDLSSLMAREFSKVIDITKY